MTDPSADSGGLRERKKRETTLRIQEAALALCLKAGYADTRVEDIAAAADVSPRTLFRYFATKEDIFRDDGQAFLETLSTMLATRPKGTDLIHVIRAYASQAAEYHVARRDFLVRRHHLFLSTPTLAMLAGGYRPRFVEALTEAVRKYAKVKPRRLRIAMGALEGAIDAALQEWLDRDGELDLDTLWSDTLDMLEPVLRDAIGG